MKKAQRLSFFMFSVCSLLCGRLLAAVPDGYVVRIDSTMVYLDWGKASGVQVGDRFDVYREGSVLKHPVTGEVLGKTEQKLGAGTLLNVEAKFSTAHLETSPEGILAGDRTRWLAPVAAPIQAPTPTPAAPQETSLTPNAPMLSELWRSEPLEKDASGIAFADLDGDGKKDIIVAYRKKIVAYRLKDKKLEPIGTYENRKYRRWLAIDTADLKHDGHEELFATVFLEGMNRPHIIVLRFENGGFHQMADIEGFARSVQRMDGSRHLYWQNMSRSHDISYTAVSELLWEKNAYKPGAPLDLKLFSDQLFGFTWGDWFKSKHEDFALLEHGERIRLFSSDFKWKSSDVFGGTKNDFSIDDNTLGSVYPRLFRWRPAQADRDQLIVSTNHSDFGVRMTYLKLYRKSEVAGLAWNGLEMKPVWSLPITGYLPDYGIADVLGESKPQLWAAAVGPGDKTVLLAFTLP